LAGDGEPDPVGGFPFDFHAVLPPQLGTDRDKDFPEHPELASLSAILSVRLLAKLACPHPADVAVEHPCDPPALHAKLLDHGLLDLLASL